MLRRYAVIALLLACGLLVAVLPSSAEDKKADDKKPADAEATKADIIQDVVTANRMAEFGRNFKVPEALVAAGSLLRKAYLNSGGTMGEIKEKPTDETGKEVAATEKGKDLKDQAADLFEEARTMAAEEKVNVEPLIKAAEKRTYGKGAFGGPRKINRALNPGQLHEYKIPFISGEAASVGLTSQGSNLRFTIKSENGTELFGIRGNYANYDWTPRGGATRTFTIVVENIGKKGSVYTLLTN